MAKQEDIIDRLWSEVINLDPDGAWCADCLKENGKKSSHFKQSAEALRHLIDAGAERLDLGRVGRFIRYEACFGVLYALEDPGPDKGQIKGLHKAFEASNPCDRKTWKPHRGFIQSLWESIDLDDDGAWLGDLAKESGNGPFEDTGPAVKRLLAKGGTLKDLALVGAWHGYCACLATLKLIEQAGFSDAEESAGFHELLLGADPSGKEGRPGSWPLDDSSLKRAKAGRSNAIAPLWQVRSGQTIAFSPDSKFLAVAGASGPVRLYDSRSGKERLVCEGLKSHISHVAFSPDGRRIAVAEMYQRLNACDAKTGRVLWKARFPQDNEVRGLAYSTRTGDLLRSSSCRVIDVLDAQTGQIKEPLRPAASTRRVDAISFLDAGNKLAAVWSPKGHKQYRVNVWSWPGREPLVRFGHIAEFVHDIAASADGKVLAVPNYKNGVALYDTTSGQALRQIATEPIYHVAFTPKENLLVGGTDKPELCFWDIQTGEERLRIPAGSSSNDVLQIAVSPDGQFLAAATSRGVIVWKVPQGLS